MNRGLNYRWHIMLTAVLLFPAAAFAHPGVHGVSGYVAGFVHPMSGIDHILVMLAVGLWAAQQGGRAMWWIPASFVSMMIIGAILGMEQVPLPFVEQGIIASVMVMGVLIVAALRLPTMAGAILVSLFAIFHGHAHGSELPLSAAGLHYVIGFTIATTMLHATGIGLGVMLRRLDAMRLARFAGGAIALSGLYLVFA